MFGEFLISLCLDISRAISTACHGLLSGNPNNKIDKRAFDH